MSENVGDTNLRNLFSVNLKRLRGMTKMSQMELADKTGLAQNFINDIEHQKKWPSDKTIAKLIKALKVEPYQFFISEEKLNIEKADLFMEDLSDSIATIVKDHCSRYIVNNNKKKADESGKK